VAGVAVVVLPGLFALLILGSLPAMPVHHEPGGVLAPAAVVTVWGKVFDGQTRGPLLNAHVAPAGGIWVASGANGLFVVNVSAGRVPFLVTAQGFHTGAFVVNASGVSFETNFTLQPFTFGIHGAVVDASTQLGLPGATVTVSALNLSVVTTTLGNYRVAVENGSYTVVAAASGFDPESIVVAVNGSPVPQYFLLHRTLTHSSTDRSAGILPTVPLLLLGVGAGGVAAVLGYGLAVRARDAARRRPSPLAGLPAERDEAPRPGPEPERRSTPRRRR